MNLLTGTQIIQMAADDSSLIDKLIICGHQFLLCVTCAPFKS